MQPLTFSPILKRIRWGGRRLGTLLGKPIGPENDYAESWEIVDHGDDQSVVMGGPYVGWTLKQLVEECGEELLGRHAGRTQFPLLIKFLDAHDRLSLQVHPNDRQAKTFDPAENGKTEAWVIVHADPRSRLYAGLKSGVTRDSLQRHLGESRLEDCLHSFEVSAGDCVFIPAGTVHAIAEGIVLAEIQQSSDLTFRLSDWGRLGTDGEPRPLHIKEALSCIDFERGPVSPVVPTKFSDHTEELVRCEYFVIHRHRTSRPYTLEVKDRFHVLMMLSGEADLVAGGRTTPLEFAQTVLIPAACPDVQIMPRPGGEAVLLDAFLP